MTLLGQDVLEEAADTCAAIADRLASPHQPHNVELTRRWSRQSLASGALGIALLHVERAYAGLSPWQRAHNWLTHATGGGVTGSDDCHLYYGAPALAFVLHGATDRSGRYSRALNTLDQAIVATTRRRLDRAHARIDRGDLPALSEFDAIRGLTGIGAHLLRRDPDSELLRAVLAYLVRLTEPIKVHCAGDGALLPGWWSKVAPSGRQSSDLPGGHANHGVAHGVAGPLALLSLTLRREIRIDGQTEAIERICAWLEQWRQVTDTGTSWPYWITRAEHRDQRLSPSRPKRRDRPSWCYGTAGVARSLQLAGIALHDTDRQRLAEDALTGAFTDQEQLNTITDLSLCRGYAGLLQVAIRAAANALTPALTSCLSTLLTNVIRGPDTASARAGGSDISFLDGAAGIALALHTAASPTSRTSTWDSCLLID